jgi:steroid 5-alpha reductase family enzyme
MLCEKTGKFYPIINFIGIHYVPTLVVYGCILPAVMVIENKPEINALSIIFACVSVASATMQGVADIQMHKYRKNKTTSFIRNGLWRNSRHPNYLGEILMWWGIGLSAVCAMPNMWYLIFGAIANTVLFLSVSIPMADGRQSRKEGFAQYKAETRMLLPIRKFK